MLRIEYRAGPLDGGRFTIDQPDDTEVIPFDAVKGSDETRNTVGNWVACHIYRRPPGASVAQYQGIQLVHTDTIAKGQQR